MRILSIDVGTRNMGWARWVDGKVTDVGVLDLNCFGGGTDYALKVKCLNDSGFFSEVDTILVEVQMRSCMKTIANTIRCFHWEKTIRIAPQCVRRHFRTVTRKHRTNKKAHVALLESMPLSKLIRQRIASHRKKDDIADAVVQLMYYVNTSVNTSEKDTI